MKDDDLDERLEDLEERFGVDDNPMTVVIIRDEVVESSDEVDPEDVIEYTEHNGRELAVIDRERTEVEV